MNKINIFLNIFSKKRENITQRLFKSNKIVFYEVFKLEND